jgi:O-antigen/teichoic acid export membrane protein
MAARVKPLGRRTLLNALALFGGEGMSRSATFFVAIIVAHRFGATALGQYGFALAVASIFAIVPDFGLHLLTTREIVIHPKRLRQIFWNLHWLKIFLVCGVAAFVVLFGHEVVQDPVRRVLLYLLVTRALLQSFSQIYMAILKAFERMHYIALQQFSGAVMAVACATGALVLRAHLFVVVSSLLVEPAIEALIGWRIILRRFEPGKVYAWNPILQWSMLVAAAPIGFTIALQALNLRLDVVALGIFANNLDLGRFQAAAWFLVGTFLCVSLLMNVVFPKLSRLFQQPSQRSRAYVESLLKNGSFLAISGSIAVWLGAPWILREFYGPSLAVAVGLLRILALALPFMFLNTMLSYVFIAARLRAVYLGTLAWGVGIGILLSVVLAQRYGATGVSVADVIREFLMTLMFLVHLKRKHVALEAGRSLLRAYVILASLAGALSIVSQAVRPLTEWPILLELLMLGGTLIVVGLPRRQELLLLVDETS